MRFSMMAVMALAAGLMVSVPVRAAEEATTQKAGKRAGRGPRGTPWKLGVQAWTFHQETLFEAIDHAKELGLRYIELIPSQALSPENKSVKFDEDASDDLIRKVQEKLRASGVRAIAFGVVRMENEASARKSFEFAKKMGIQTITAEPPQDAMKMVDRLANEYGINVAIHNHPKPSHYWDPQTVLKALEGCGRRVGACADVGHWRRSGLEPIECLKKLEGRVLACHFKDLNEKSPKAHDVAWGTGINDAKGLLAELKRQGFDGPLMIEYEYNWGKAMPEIGQCIDFFRKTVREMGDWGGRKAMKKQ